MSPERSIPTELVPDSQSFPKKLVERVKSMGIRQLPALYFFRKLTGINVDHDAEAIKYVLSVISESSPQINFVGDLKDKICANQIDLLINGIVEGYPSGSWKNLNPNAPLKYPFL